MEAKAAAEAQDATAALRAEVIARAQADAIAQQTVHMKKQSQNHVSRRLICLYLLLLCGCKTYACNFSDHFGTLVDAR